MQDSFSSFWHFVRVSLDMELHLLLSGVVCGQPCHVNAIYIRLLLLLSGVVSGQPCHVSIFEIKLLFSGFVFSGVYQHILDGLHMVAVWMTRCMDTLHCCLLLTLVDAFYATSDICI